MTKQGLIYEGKAKCVYKTENADLYILEYKNTATALNGQKREDIEDKGELNCAICAEIYKYLEKNGIHTHFLKTLSKTEMLVKRVEIIPLEVIMRNVTAGSFSKKYGVKEGVRLKLPALEFSYKDDALGDPMINTSQALALGLSSEESIKTIKTLTERINQLLIDYFLRLDLTLVDFKLEYGLADGEIVLADEISPDTCRLWDVNTNEKLDKDRFRRDLGRVSEAYREVFRRMSAL